MRQERRLHEARVDGVAAIVEGDAFAFLRERREPIDFVFLDAEKEDYTAFLELIVPLLPPGGLPVADNLTSHAHDLAEFRPNAPSGPRLEPEGAREQLRSDAGGKGEPAQPPIQ